MKFNWNIFQKNKKKLFVCPGAFSQVYIYHDGRVHLCPDCYMGVNSSIGNLNENSFDEIWNSKKAQQIRKEILNGKYNYCFPVSCFEKSNFNIKITPFKNIEYAINQSKYPEMVCIGPDWECNANCVMCRKELVRLDSDELENFNAKIENLYLPILKDAKFLTLSTTGDPFASRNTRKLITLSAKKYPDLKFNILTNGILCDEFNCSQLGISNRISKIMVSLHSSNQQTYDKVVKNGDFNKVVKNIKWLKTLKSESKINELYLGFVVSSKNYDDIPNFIEFSKENNAVALFWSCIDWGGNLSYSDEPLDITDEKHPKYRDFLEIIKNIDMNTPNCYFNNRLKYIKSCVRI